MSLRVRLLCDGGRRIQELKMVGVTTAKLGTIEDADNDESTDCNV